jgi:beta-glucosidase
VDCKVRLTKTAHYRIRRLTAFVLLLVFPSGRLASQFEDRVESLLMQMTVPEKISQLGHDAPAIERLGLPAYNWWNEALHGVARSGRATVFPPAIGLAATWDPDLMLRVATAIADEARAKHHEYVRQGRRDIYQGLTFFSPNINLYRDPRWGRGMETYGEDPLLTSVLANAFIRGMQGEDPVHRKTIATAKHFAVHSGPEADRHHFNAIADEKDLIDSYLPHFESAVKDAGVESVMCAYNAVNGVPMCANSDLLETTLRQSWGFKGFVVSDCWGISDIHSGHHFAADVVEASAMALLAGTDLSCGPEYTKNLSEALQRGLISEADLDRALRRLLTARLKLFDDANPYCDTPYKMLESPAHQALALEAARKSIVLLKNENGILPLSKDIRSLAVIGPNADDVNTLFANYNGYPSASITPLQALRDRVPTVYYAAGSDLAPGIPVLEAFPFALHGRYYDTDQFTDDDVPVMERLDNPVDYVWWDPPTKFGVRWTGRFIAPASGRYYIGAEGQNSVEVRVNGHRVAGNYNITERGLSYSTIDLVEGESYSIGVDLRAFQNDASIRLLWARPAPDRIEKAVEAASNADAIVMFLGLSAQIENEGMDRDNLDLPEPQQELLDRVLETGKPVIVVLMSGGSINLHRDVAAVLQAWYPGQAAGTAIADVLFGDHNPSGRLPVTFYHSVADLPPFRDYSMSNRTYRYFTGDVLYPFGYGLSYTTFQTEEISRDESGHYSATVTNTGKRAGEELVKIFSDGALTAFGKVYLQPGESKRITLSNYYHRRKE